MEVLDGVVYEKPFPHIVIENFYNKEELELIWEELKFFTKPGKLLDATGFGGIPDKTNSHALILDDVFSEQRNLSNILTVNRKLFRGDLLKKFSEIHDCCSIASKANYDVTKLRYYHDGEYYKPHIDAPFQFLAFTYFYKEPNMQNSYMKYLDESNSKRFSGGEIYFPKYDYEFSCYNNSMIMFPGWVEHGVREVSIKNSDFYDGLGRYCFSSFFGSKSASVSKALNPSSDQVPRGGGNS